MARKKKLDAIDIAAQQRAREQAEVEQAFLTGVRTLRDFIAPSSLELTTSASAQSMGAPCTSTAIRASYTPVGSVR